MPVPTTTRYRAATQDRCKTDVERRYANWAAGHRPHWRLRGKVMPIGAPDSRRCSNSRCSDRRLRPPGSKSSLCRQSCTPSFGPTIRLASLDKYPSPPCAKNARYCRIVCAPDQAGQARSSRAVRSQHRRACRPTVAFRPATPHRVCVGIGLRRWDNITLGDGEGQGERAPSRRYGARSVGRHDHPCHTRTVIMEHPEFRAHLVSCVQLRRVAAAVVRLPGLPASRGYVA